MKSKFYILITIFLLLAGVSLFNNLINLTSLAIGYPMGDVIHSGKYIEYVAFAIQVLFVLHLFVSVSKGIYIKGSIVLGVISGLILFLKVGNSGRVLVGLFYACEGILCLVVTLYLMFNIRPSADEVMKLFSGIMKGMSSNNKLILAAVLLGVCIACAIYIICPKKWVCLYVDSNQNMNISYEINNDVLTVGDEFVIENSIIVNYMSYEAGWKFYANKSGNANVSITSVAQYDNSESDNHIWDIYVDENMYVHYDADFEYYLKVYNFIIFLSVIFLGVSIVFVISAFIDRKRG